MGATALDAWREREKELDDGRFQEFGIAEQGMISAAAGMAKAGKRPFIYAIANFVTKRIHEFHVVNSGIQKLPYVTLGVGTGYSYDDSGPTHYMLEDISIMRTIPNLEILSPSNSFMAAALTKEVARNDNPVYMRLERSVLPLDNVDKDLERGFSELEKGDELCLISTGNMVHRTMEVQKALEEEGIHAGVIDLWRLKPLNEEGLVETLNGYEKAVTIEEHYLAGGLGGIIAETVLDNRIPLGLRRIGVPQEDPYFYGRENIHREFGLDKEALVKKVKDFIQ